MGGVSRSPPLRPAPPPPLCRDQWAWASQNPQGYLTGASEAELAEAKAKGLL